jgi:hypothetical protein
MKPVAVILFLLVALTGCSSMDRQAGDPGRDTAALLAPNLRLDLPDPASMGRSIEAVQMVTAHHDGDTVVFEAHLSVTPERALLVGVDATGQRLMTVTWRGNDITVERSPFLPQTVRPGAMLADLVVLYWPVDVVRQALKSSGASLTVDTASRIISQHGKPVLEARYQGGATDPWGDASLHYRNLAWGYDIDVVTLQVSK